MEKAEDKKIQHEAYREGRKEGLRKGARARGYREGQQAGAGREGRLGSIGRFIESHQIDTNKVGAALNGSQFDLGGGGGRGSSSALERNLGLGASSKKRKKDDFSDLSL